MNNFNLINNQLIVDRIGSDQSRASSVIDHAKCLSTAAASAWAAANQVELKILNSW